MKAVAPTIKLDGPTESNAASYGEPSSDTSCVTTNGPNSACADGDPGYSNNDDYIPYLLTYGNPKPDVITFHGYGGIQETPESTVFNNIRADQMANFNRLDKSLVDHLNIPVWIDELNYNAGNPPGGDYRSMTQVGSAWLADAVVQWAKDDTHVQHLIQWNIDAQGVSWQLFGTASDAPNKSTCIPQPACTHIENGEPDLEYWSMYEINRLLTSGYQVPVSNVPTGFSALAVQTDAHHVVLLLVNTRQGNDNGIGASATVRVHLKGATVTDAHDTAINGSTSVSTGPSTVDLGAQSRLSISSAGYQVDLIQFKVT
jgi:hypothetical protein